MTADHLRQLPEEDVARVVAVIRSELPHMPHGLRLELDAFSESRTRWDAMRVEKALRHAYGRPGLADEILDLLGGDGLAPEVEGPS